MVFFHLTYHSSFQVKVSTDYHQLLRAVAPVTVKVVRAHKDRLHPVHHPDNQLAPLPVHLLVNLYLSAQ